MFRNTFISTLSILAIILGVTSNTRADLAPQAIDIISNPNNSIAQLNTDRTATSTNDDRYRSMEYIQKGLAAQQQGDITDAAFNYYQSLQKDPVNPHAFMAIGMLLGGTKEGISCVKAAAMLYELEGNQEGHRLAMNWLTARNITE